MKKLTILFTALAILLANPVLATNVEEGLKTQTLHIGNSSEPESLDPGLIQGNIERDIVMTLFEGLCNYDPKTLEPIPGVAERWEVSADKLTYTFYLRKNAKWNNGDPVTAHDFAAAWQRAISPELASVYSFILFPVKNAKAYNKGEIKDFSKVGIKAKDDHTFVVTLAQPTPYFMSLAPFQTLMPIHKKSVEAKGGFMDRQNPWARVGMVTNGAFQLKSWKLNDSLVVEKNPTYWDAANVKLNKVVFYPINGEQIEERAFRAGQIHKVHQIGISKIATYKKKRPSALRIDTYLSTYYYLINTTVKPLNDPRVRRALSLAVDRDMIVKYVTKGGQNPAHYFTPPGTGGFNGKGFNQNNVELAKKLLAEAGYPEGKGFPKVTLLYNTLEKHKVIAEAIQQMWKKNLGVDIELTNQEWKVYVNSINNQNFMLARRGWIGDYPDPNTFLDLLISDSPNNLGKWQNKEFDKVMLASQNTMDKAKRLELFQQAEQLVHDDAAVIPIFNDVRNYLLHEDVKGWHANVMDVHPLNRVYLSRDKK